MSTSFFIFIQNFILYYKPLLKASRITSYNVCYTKLLRLYVIHVAKESWNFLNNSREGEALDYLFDISKSVGANLTVLRSDNIPETIAQFAKDHDIELIVMGETLKSDRIV